MKKEEIENILKKYNYDKSFIIGILQDLQAKENYLSKENLEYLSRELNISQGELYHLATFYKAFSLKPRGKHIFNVCLGTACHVRGGANIKEKLERDLGIKAGETTPDKQFTLETVNCLGCCAQGPVVVLDEEYHGEMNTAKVNKILKNIKDKKREVKVGETQN
ncbi:MAG: NADH-quinone oxidoreductase subunit NuoE [Armatimonadetes bacterium]|nr:NADH-quinone oxidoreductase subunit NuoE [Armatimonadota bacterium]